MPRDRTLDKSSEMPSGEPKYAGLFFGSFNPVHLGHLVLARHMLLHHGLEQVWFVVSPQNPHKSKESLAPAYDRLEMVRLAVEPEPRFRASDVEFSLPQPSYTAVTLQYLAQKFPDKSFALIMGEDNLATLHKWKNYEEILERHRVLVYPRAGSKSTSTRDPRISQALEQGRIVETQAPIMEISSSAIRKDIAKGLGAEFVLPKAVQEFIEKGGLYRRS